MNTTSVKIPTPVVKKVKAEKKKTGIAIGNFFAIAATEKINRSQVYAIGDNSDAFRQWLTANSIEWKPNDHYTNVSTQYDVFKIGMEFGVYKNNEMKKQPVKQNNQ